MKNNNKIYSGQEVVSSRFLYLMYIAAPPPLVSLPAHSPVSVTVLV